MDVHGWRRFRERHLVAEQVVHRLVDPARAVLATGPPASFKFPGSTSGPAPAAPSTRSAAWERALPFPTSRRARDHRPPPGRPHRGGHRDARKKHVGRGGAPRPFPSRASPSRSRQQVHAPRPGSGSRVEPVEADEVRGVFAWGSAATLRDHTRDASMKGSNCTSKPWCCAMESSTSNAREASTLSGPSAARQNTSRPGRRVL
jgi:hypothetical protein